MFDFTMPLIERSEKFICGVEDKMFTIVREICFARKDLKSTGNFLNNGTFRCA